MSKKIFYIGAIAALSIGGCYLFSKSGKNEKSVPITVEQKAESEKLPREEIERVVKYLEDFPNSNKEYVKRISLLGITSDYNEEIFEKLPKKEGVFSKAYEDMREAGRELHHAGNTIEAMLSNSPVYQRLKRAKEGLCENIYERIQDVKQ